MDPAFAGRAENGIPTYSLQAHTTGGTTQSKQLLNIMNKLSATDTENVDSRE